MNSRLGVKEWGDLRKIGKAQHWGNQYLQKTVQLKELYPTSSSLGQSDTKARVDSIARVLPTFQTMLSSQTD